MDAPFGSWGTQTFIAGLSAEAMIALFDIAGASREEGREAVLGVVEAVCDRRLGPSAPQDETPG